MLIHSFSSDCSRPNALFNKITRAISLTAERMSVYVCAEVKMSSVMQTQHTTSALMHAQ